VSALAAAVLAASLGAASPGAALPAVAPPPPVDAPALAARCARGFPAECRDLGRARLAGAGVPRDERAGVAHVLAACEMGEPSACADLGVLHAVGRGLPQSDERAVALSRRACDQGAALACSNLGALLAEGVGGPPPKGAPGEEPGGPMLRLFRKACEAGVPEGCANLGTAHAGGTLAVRDVRLAARELRRGCERGLGLACHRLAALVEERPELAPDLGPSVLRARACQDGAAPACAAVGERTPAPTARTPAARLLDDPRAFALGIPGFGGFSAGELSARGRIGARPRRALADLRRPSEALQAAVPEPLRARLGVDGPAAPGAAEGALAATGGDPAVALLLALRRPQLGQCYEATRTAPAQRTEVFATLFLDGDGRPAELRAAGQPADGGLEECVRGVLEGWDFPSSAEGFTGPFLVRFEYEEAPGRAPEFAAPGGLRPGLRDPACVERRLRVPAEYGGSTGSVTVKLAVNERGAPGLVHALGPVPDAILEAVDLAVHGCSWTPGGDADGRPLPMWTTLTVRIDGR
jgi:hypothetical protein